MGSLLTDRDRLPGYAHAVEPVEYLRICLDPVRLAVLGRAAEGRVDVGEIAAAMKVAARSVDEARGRLVAAGLLSREGLLDRGRLHEIARRLPQIPDAAPGITAGSWSEDEADVLTRFFSGDRLREIPPSRAKRRIVLERLAQEFEPGIRYSEREVNFTLQLFHGDYAALRRYLVDEGFLTRAEGVYWRTGGRYPTERD